MTPDSAPLIELERLFARQKAAYRQSGYESFAIRKDRLDRALALAAKYESALMEAVDADFGGRHRLLTLGIDFVASVTELKHARGRLKAWMKPEKRPANFPLGLLGARAEVFREPKGVIANISTWNFPVYNFLGPLAGIIAAGNRCIFKANELNPASGEVMKAAAGEYFNEDEFAVVLGGPETSAAVCALPFDHILFTGSERAGRLVMGAAAKNLTPVTLELGGKCPAIVSKSANIEAAAKKIIFGKMTNAGQICLAPDYLLVHESLKPQLVEALVKESAAQFPNAPSSDEYCAVISDAHVERLNGLVEDARAKGARITVVDEVPTGDNLRKLPLHILEDVTDDMRVMQEEIFGPLLPVIPYADFEEVTARARRMPKPLASYYFGHNKAEEQALLRHIPSGSTTINDVLFHVLQAELPFGGVGASGMGQYHGFEGYCEFTNPRAVFRQTPFDIGRLLRPPFSPKTEGVLRKLM